MTTKIAVQMVSNIVTAESGRQYWTLKDFTEKKYICFNPKLKDYCQVGGEIEADISPGKSPTDTPRLDMIYINGKPVIEIQPKSMRPHYGKSKEELAQQRQLAEAQNRSIQAQTSLNRAVDLAVGGCMPIPKESGSIDLSIVQELIADTAKEFYLLLQSLTEISEAEVIHREIKTLIKTDKAEEIETPKEIPVTNAPTLMSWALSHGKKFTPSFIRKQMNWGDIAITNEMAVEAYKTIKEISRWD